jgi:hypothetical protein
MRRKLEFDPIAPRVIPDRAWRWLRFCAGCGAVLKGGTESSIGADTPGNAGRWGVGLQRVGIARSMRQRLAAS